MAEGGILKMMKCKYCDYQYTSDGINYQNYKEVFEHAFRCHLKVRSKLTDILGESII